MGQVTHPPSPFTLPPTFCFFCSIFFSQNSFFFCVYLCVCVHFVELFVQVCPTQSAPSLVPTLSQEVSQGTHTFIWGEGKRGRKQQEHYLDIHLHTCTHPHTIVQDGSEQPKWRQDSSGRVLHRCVTMALHAAMASGEIVVYLRSRDPRCLYLNTFSYIWHCRLLQRFHHVN